MCLSIDPPPQTPLTNQVGENQAAINAAAPETAKQYSANLPTYTAANSQAFLDAIFGSAAVEGRAAVEAVPATGQEWTMKDGRPLTAHARAEIARLGPHNGWSDKMKADYLGVKLVKEGTGAIEGVKGIEARAAVPGLLSAYADRIAPEMVRIQNESNAAQTKGDLERVQQYGPDFLAALKTADPTKAALINRYNDQVMGLDLNGGLTDWQKQQYQQEYGASRARQGFGYGQNDASGEAYYMGNQQNQRMLQNLGLTQNAIGINQSAYGDPFLQITGRQSGATNAGQSFMGAGQQQGSISSGQLQNSLNPLNSYAQDYHNTGFNARAAAEIGEANNATAIASAGLGAL